LGGKVIIEEAYPSGSSDFRTQLTKIKNYGIDAIYLAAQGAENGYALRQMKELGIKSKVYGTVGLEVPEAIQTGGNALDGVFYTTTGFDPNVNSDLIRNFNSRYKNKYGETSDLFAAEGYDALRIAAYVLKKAKGDPEKVKEELYKIIDFPGVTGNITFNEFGDPVKRNIFLKTIKNNQYLILEKNL
jgi:branched-chain amino acid transport system substrate-binding protein